MTIRDVAERQLCCGCGVCAYISPAEIRMVDTFDNGHRPLLRDGAPQDPRSDEALRVCPGIELRHTYDRKLPGLIRELEAGWGPILEVWEGYAADPEIRFAGSSGGAASALALFCIEQLGFHGVLHIAARPDAPYLNHTVLSRTRTEVLAATGSRYAPASPCDGLQLIEDAPGPCVFIGKPCDVAAVQKARQIRPALDAKVGLTIAIFCAGTPSTAGTQALLMRMGIADPATVTSLRYRGNGWPGRATATCRNSNGAHTAELSYEQTWGEILEGHRLWRCYICPDHTGEFADLALGDPWHRPRSDWQPGLSLAVVRTERGRAYLQTAMAAGCLSMTRVSPQSLPDSQPGLLRSRGSLWGRLHTLRLLGIPTPRYRGVPLFRFWLLELDWAPRARSVLGTVRRALRRRLWMRRPVVPYNLDAAQDAAP